LDSIAAQSFDDFEVIIVDGGSSDDTSDVAARYGSLVSHFQAEPDSGIYDAWNKALQFARGDWISFLGADDSYAAPNALTKLSSKAVYPGVTLVSARVDMVDATGKVIRAMGESWSASRMKRYMCVAHPGAWHHRCLFDNYGKFSLKYRLAGDYEFLLRATPAIRAIFIPESLVTMELGGISNRLYWLHVVENYSALKEQSACGRFHAIRFLVRATLGRAYRNLGFGSNGIR
jgi:glycosyltransferase involved in cell wall biosynthesis